MNIIRYWNSVSLQLVADDHTGNPPAGRNGGPTRTSRALAMIHLAMHDTVGAITKKFEPYLQGLDPVGQTASIEAAVSHAALRVALALYPGQATTIQSAFDGVAFGFPAGGPGVDEGVVFGEHVATRLMQARANDKSGLPESYDYGTNAGNHRPDPHSPGQTVLGSQWGQVTPFTYATGADVSLDKYPDLNKQDYASAFEDVYKNGRNDLPTTNPDKAMKGIFWGYDGAQKLGTPPRLYNQIVRIISEEKQNSLVEDAQLFALINVGMADAGISAWHWKYVYNLWRPVVAIREANVGSGPAGEGDGNADTMGDPFWCPLGAPDTNGTKLKNFTPNFPAYPSGHSTFGSTCFLLTAWFYKKEPKDIEFTFTSDEFNGVNRDSTNVIRPRLRRKFTLEEALKENGRSRIYLGVHWEFDNSGGEKLGGGVAEKVFKYFKQPGQETEKPTSAISKAIQITPAALPAVQIPLR